MLKREFPEGNNPTSGVWERPASVSANSLFVDGSDTASHTLVYNMLAFTQHMESARDAVAHEFDLTGPQYTIFMAIVRLEGETGIPGNALASLLQVSPAFITLEVKRLIARGFVIKTVDPTDRRKLQLRASPEGRKALQRNADLVCKMNDLLFGALTPDEFRQLISLASKLTSRSARTADVINTHCQLSRHPPKTPLRFEQTHRRQ